MIKKLQEEIHTLHDLCTMTLRMQGLENKDDAASLRESISLNHVTLRQELSRLGDKGRTDGDAAIATLEAQLESVQRSLDEMLIDNNHANSLKV